MKSENLNFLEPSGQLQACNGTALPFMGYNTIFEQMFVLTFQRSVLPPLPGSLHLIQGDAEVIGRRKYVGYLARLQGLWLTIVSEKGTHDGTLTGPIAVPSSLSLTVSSGVAYHHLLMECC